MPYSNTDLMVSLYNKSSVALSKNLTLRSTASFPFAFKHAIWTCFSQSKFDENHRPKCLCWWTLEINLPSRMRGGEFKRYLFCEKIKSLLLPALKITFHFLARALIFSKSLLITLHVIAGSFPNENRQVSSANKRTSDSRSSRMSFMNIIQSKGPKRDP